jgi:hypothetical protein
MKTSVISSLVFLAAICLALPLPISSAQQPAAPAAAATAGDQAIDVEVEEGVQLRNPFWPVDYWPKAKTPTTSEILSSTGQVVVATNKEPNWVAAHKQVRLYGTTKFEAKDNTVKSYAMINGKLRMEGDIIDVAWEDLIYRFRVQRIAEKNVVVLKQLNVRPR